MSSVLLIGLGSMGKRRIRLIQQLRPSIRIVGIDSQESRRTESERLYGIETHVSLEKAMDGISPEAGFVCTSPLSHRAIITELLENGINVFTELNLVSDGYHEMIGLAEEKKKALFLSSPFLYRKDICYIIDRVKNEKVDYLIHIGQYLPDWHPWESYKNFFVGDRRTNACREMMSVDFPWILAAFGKVKDCHVRCAKNSDLDLDYADNYILSMEHENGSKGAIVFDLLSRKAVRSALIFSDKLQISWNGVPDSLMEYDIENKCDRVIQTYTEQLDHQSAYAANIIENAYLDEIRTFFGIIDGTETARYTFEDDMYTLALIDRIEEYK